MGEFQEVAQNSALHNNAYMLFCLLSRQTDGLARGLCMTMPELMATSVYLESRFLQPRPIVAISGVHSLSSALFLHICSGITARTSSSYGRNTVIGRIVERSAIIRQPHVVPMQISLFSIARFVTWNYFLMPFLFRSYIFIYVTLKC